MSNFSVVIKFLGDELNPNEISEKLMVSADWSAEKGEMLSFPMPNGRIAKRQMTTGFWQISSATDSQSGISKIALQLIERIKAEPNVIAEVSSLYRGQIIFTNEAVAPDIGFTPSEDLSKAILKLGLKVYINDF